MEKIMLVEKKEMFDKLGVAIGQLYWNLNEDEDFILNGSLSYTGWELEDYTLSIAVSFCDSEEHILYILKNNDGFCFDLLDYVTFSISYAELTRFIDLNKLHHIEIYPCVIRK